MLVVAFPKRSSSNLQSNIGSRGLHKARAQSISSFEIYSIVIGFSGLVLLKVIRNVPVFVEEYVSMHESFVRFAVDGKKSVAQTLSVKDVDIYGEGPSVRFEDPERQEWNQFHCCKSEADANVQVILSGVKQVRLPTGEVFTFGPGQPNGIMIDFSDILPDSDFEDGISGHSTRVLVAVIGVKIPRLAA